MEAQERDDGLETRVIVIGTGTGVGKTHLCVALLEALAALGRVAVGLKPVESGVGEGESDSARLAAASTFHVKHPPPYAFVDAVSPHLAARRAGVDVLLPEIESWVFSCAAPWTIVETAGGLLSPLAQKITNLDLARSLAPTQTVLVGVDRLGVLHEVAACLSVLARESDPLAQPLVVLQAPTSADQSTGTNADELVTLGTCSAVLMVPRGEPNASAVRAAAMTLAASLQARAANRVFHVKQDRR